MNSTLAHRYQHLLEQVLAASAVANREKTVRIIAVSKAQPAEVLIDAFDSGIATFGENYAGEFLEKYLVLSALGLHPEWHFIGHLQTNKAKLIAPFVTMIHSVDSLKLAREISSQAINNKRVIDICIQVNTSGEDSKSGCSPLDLVSLMQGMLVLPGINVRGLMTIPSFTTSDDELRREFRQLRLLLGDVNAQFPTHTIDQLSMGMSNDFLIAIQEGATLVRIGTAIFGERNYPKSKV